MARIRLADYQDLPSDKHHLLESVSSSEGLKTDYKHLIQDPKRVIWQALGRSPSIAEGFRAFAGVVWENCDIGARNQELAILTTARELECAYEWHQHVRIALKKGLKPNEIRQLSKWDLSTFSPAERTMIRYVRAYVRRKIEDPLHEEFVEAFDERATIEVGTLVNVYVAVVLIADALELQTEEEFVGWNLEGLES